jgi:hypothetical protein
MVPLIVQAASIFAAALLAYCLGLRSYKKQKSMEECRKKYIEEGVDALIDDLSRSVATVHRNWAAGVWAANLSKDLPKDEGARKGIVLPRLFEQHREAGMGLTFLHRVEDLLGTHTFYDWYFEANADFLGMQLFAALDVDLALRHFVEHPEFYEGNAEALLGSVHKQLDSFRGRCRRHEGLLEALQELSRTLWASHLDFDEVPSVRNRPKVVEIRKVIETRWANLHAAQETTGETTAPTPG